MNLDTLGRTELGRLFREACQAAGMSNRDATWDDLDEDTRGEYRVAGDHLRAALKARLSETSCEAVKVKEA